MHQETYDNHELQIIYINTLKKIEDLAYLLIGTLDFITKCLGFSKERCYFT